MASVSCQATVSVPSGSLPSSAEASWKPSSVVAPVGLEPSLASVSSVATVPSVASVTSVASVASVSAVASVEADVTAVVTSVAVLSPEVAGVVPDESSSSPPHDAATRRPATRTAASGRARRPRRCLVVSMVPLCCVG